MTLLNLRPTQIVFCRDFGHWLKANSGWLSCYCSKIQLNFVTIENLCFFADSGLQPGSFDNVLVQSCRLNQHRGYIRNCTHHPSPSIIILPSNLLQIKWIIGLDHRSGQFVITDLFPSLIPPSISLYCISSFKRSNCLSSSFINELAVMQLNFHYFQQVPHTKTIYLQHPDFPNAL